MSGCSSGLTLGSSGNNSPWKSRRSSRVMTRTTWMSLSTAWLLVNVGMAALPVFPYPVFLWVHHRRLTAPLAPHFHDDGLVGRAAPSPFTAQERHACKARPNDGTVARAHGPFVLLG